VVQQEWANLIKSLPLGIEVTRHEIRDDKDYAKSKGCSDKCVAVDIPPQYANERNGRNYKGALNDVVSITQ
jgi:hypothetical protein